MNTSDYNRRNFLRNACLGTASLALSGRLTAGESTSSKMPNLVFILADDLGWSDLGCYGSDLHETPHIDRLAAQSLKFSNAYAAAPVCTPTRASIMTGKYPARLNMTIWSENSRRRITDRKQIPPLTLHDLPHEEVTIAEVFKQAGYSTAHVGKWHLGNAAHFPETQGFDANIGGTMWGAPNTFFYPYSGTGTFGNEFRYVPHLEFGYENEYLTDRLTDEALSIIEKTGNNPFFLYLAYHTVHTPIEGKKEIVDYYKNKIAPAMRHRNPEYAAMVHSLDENVGRVLSKLDDLGIAENTVVIFFSDNGGYINKFKDTIVTNNYPLRSGKGSLYEGGIREPLIIRWPGITSAGSECSYPVSSIDFYPTLLEMFGLKGDPRHNANVDGIGLGRLLKEPGDTLDRDTLFWHYPHYYPTTTPVSAVRKEDWKLLEYFEDGHLELYNLKDDPGETNNLTNKEPEKSKELYTLLNNWRSEVNAQLPAPNPDYK